MTDTIIRVCAMCQKETKTVLPSVPGIAYSHGACRRHALQSFAEILGEKKARRYLRNKGKDYYCPDMLARRPARLGDRQG